MCFVFLLQVNMPELAGMKGRHKRCRVVSPMSLKAASQEA